MTRRPYLSRLLHLTIAIALLVIFTQPALAQGEPTTEQVPSKDTPPFTDTVSMQKILHQSRPRPSTPEEWAEYNALLRLREAIETGKDAKYREAQKRKRELLPALYSPEYREARNQIGRAITELLQSGRYSLEEIATMDLQEMEQALGRKLPVISGDLRIKGKAPVKSASGISPARLHKGKARRGDIILVHNGRIWKPAWYGYWTHTIVVRGYDRYMHAPGPGRPVTHATWRDDIAGRTAAIMGVWTWSGMRNKAASYAEAQWGEPYNALSPKWSTREWYCSKLPWAGYYYKSWGIIDIDGTAWITRRYRWQWWWWYWVTPDDIWLSFWTYIRDISVSA